MNQNYKEMCKERKNMRATSIWFVCEWWEENENPTKQGFHFVDK